MTKPSLLALAAVSLAAVLVAPAWSAGGSGSGAGAGSGSGAGAGAAAQPAHRRCRRLRCRQFRHLSTLRVSRNAEGKFVAEELKKEVELRSQFASAEIRSNFWSAGIEAGLSEAQIMSLAGIFGWDIDFGLDIRAGDSFSVLYETQYVDGEFISNGNIVAAQFSNQGHLYQAVRHTDGNYYKPDGASMRQAFLRAPVSFQYVSSNFNPRRLHPVTGRVRPHNGTDFATPTGTAVLAAADGTVIRVEKHPFAGRYVEIQHHGQYKTRYLHLNRALVRTSQRVERGQRIALSGATIPDLAASRVRSNWHRY